MNKVTQKMNYCFYCHGEYTVHGYYVALIFDSKNRRIIASADSEAALNNVKYCPMCGRKWGEDE